MIGIRLAALSAALVCVIGCAQLRPAAETAVDAIDAACTLGLVDAVAVQVSAADRGIPVEVLADLLCSVPEVYEAWTLARGQRTDPAAAAVLRAREMGLL